MEYNHIMKKTKGYLVKLYNCLMRTRWIHTNNRFCRRFRAIFIHNICKEMNVSFGEKNPDKLFYVIRDPKGEHGLFALYNFVMFHLKIAEKRNAIPVVDVQYYPLEGMIEDDKIGYENAWEYFFEQTSSYSLKEVYESCNVIMAAGIDAASLSEVYDEEELKTSREISKKYIHIKKEILDICNAKYQDFDMEHRKILGVICRGTDYIATRPQGHSIVPTAQKTINIIEEKEKEWGSFDAVFLATEDANIFHDMQDYYGNNLLFYQKIRIDDTNGDFLCKRIEKISLQNKEESFKKKMMTEYLISIWLLSKCNSLIAPVIGSTLGVLCMGDGFEHQYFIQLGNYGE